MADLHLNPDDQRRLAVAMSALLSPLDYADAATWRTAVNRAVRPLLGADKALFILPVGGRANSFSEEYAYDPDGLALYADEITPLVRRLSALDGGVSAFDRMRRLGVADRPAVWGRHYDRYYRSAYWNEYLRPNGAFGGFSVTAAVGPEPGLHGFAQLIVHHGGPHEAPFGGRAHALGALLLPALRAGALAWTRLHEARSALAAAVDALPVPVALFGLDGRELHRNGALVRLLGAEPGGWAGAEAVMGPARDLARRAGRLAAGAPVPVGDGPGAAVEGAARTGAADYALRATRAGPTATGHAEAVVVTVERRGRALPSEGALREAFGLTPQQARVALLLAERKTNPEVAAALSVSPHTARHHAEAVLAKLGVHDRRDVRDALRRQRPLT